MQRLIIVVLFFITFVAGLFIGQVFEQRNSVVAAEKSSIVYTIDNCLAELDESNVEKTSKGWVNWFVRKENTNGLNLKMSQVKAQQARHGSHTHDGEEIFFILKGNAEFTLKEKRKVVGANSALYCPPGVEHGIRNAGDEPMRYLVIRVD